MDDNTMYIDIKKIYVRDLYNTICNEMSFNQVVHLYSLLKHKMTYLDDEPYCEVAVYENDR